MGVHCSRGFGEALPRTHRAVVIRPRLFVVSLLFLFFFSFSFFLVFSCCCYKFFFLNFFFFFFHGPFASDRFITRRRTLGCLAATGLVQFPIIPDQAPLYTCRQKYHLRGTLSTHPRYPTVPTLTSGASLDLGLNCQPICSYHPTTKIEGSTDELAAK